MRRTLIAVAAVTVAFALAGCGGDLLSPRVRSLGSSAARPGAPPTLTTSPVSASAISMTWQDNESNESGWEVHRSTTGVAGSYAFVASVGANVTSFVDIGLAPGKEYCYKVRSFKKSGPKTTYGAFLAASCSTTYSPPVPASNLDARPVTNEGIVVTWSDNSSDEQGFMLQRAPSANGEWTNVAPLTSGFIDRSQPTETLACYRVLAYNQWGNSAPSNVDCTLRPARPTGFTARPSGAESIDLSWVNGSIQQDGLELEQSLNNIDFVHIADLAAAATTYHDAGLTADVRYTYRLRPKRDGGFSEYADYVSSSPIGGPPRPPGGVAARPLASTLMEITFNDVSPSTQGVHIERSLDHKVTWTAAGDATLEPYYNTGYFYDYGTPVEQEVCYRAIAFNTSPGTGAEQRSVPSAESCTAAPATPTNVDTSAIDDLTTKVTWTDNSNLEDGYEVWTYAYDYWNDYYYENVYWVAENTNPAPNAMSFQFSSSEIFEGVRAAKDGGASDWGTSPDAGASAMNPTTSMMRAARAKIERQKTTSPAVGPMRKLKARR